MSDEENIKHIIINEQLIKDKIAKSWSYNIECNIKIIGEKSAAASKIHYSTYRHYVKMTNRLTYFNIIMSTVAGTAGFSSISENNNTMSLYLNICIAVINILTALVSSFLSESS